MMVHTSETVRLKFFIDLLMNKRHPVMLVGTSGCGKSALLNEKLNSLPEEYAVCNVPFNFYTTSGKNVLSSIPPHLQERKLK